GSRGPSRAAAARSRRRWRRAGRRSARVAGPPRSSWTRSRSAMPRPKHPRARRAPRATARGAARGRATPLPGAAAAGPASACSPAGSGAAPRGNRLALVEQLLEDQARRGLVELLLARAPAHAGLDELLGGGDRAEPLVPRGDRDGHGTPEALDEGHHLLRLGARRAVEPERQPDH